MSGVKLGLGSAASYTPLSDNLSQDPVINSVKAALASGDGAGTQNYYQHVNTMSSLFQQFATEGQAAWSSAPSSEIPGATVYYVSAVDSQNKEYYISIAPRGLKQENGNVVPNSTTQTINGITYNGLMVVDMTCGYDNYDFSKLSWWLGTAVGGAVAAKVVLPVAWNIVKAIAKTMAEKIKATFSDPAVAEGGDETEEVEDTAETSAETDIEEEVGEEVAVAAAEEGGIALGTVFIGVGVALAIAFIVASFILHNSFHKLRVWNFTKYKVTWKLYFDDSQVEDQGQLHGGPVTWDGDKIKTQAPFPPVSKGPPVPGTDPVNQAAYSDFSFNSSHDFSGIGYVLQLYLQDTSGNAKYTATVYFDIPFATDNSTNVTFDVTGTDDKSLQNWYSNNQGNNKSHSASATSSDSKITVSTTYDYLSGKHVIPDAGAGGGSNEGYYYQSILSLIDEDLVLNKSAVPAKVEVPIPRMVSAPRPSKKSASKQSHHHHQNEGNKKLGRLNHLQHLSPAMRKRLFEAIRAKAESE